MGESNHDLIYINIFSGKKDKIISYISPLKLIIIHSLLKPEVNLITVQLKNIVVTILFLTW